jgi:hypothetical protein
MNATNNRLVFIIQYSSNLAGFSETCLDDDRHLSKVCAMPWICSATLCEGLTE